jgi:hypothetical protein
LSRERALKATAAGLQPKGLDLTQYAPARVANRVESTQRISNEIAAYALGFAVSDHLVDDNVVPGAPLATVLLRLKYAEQVNPANFTQAHRLLVHTYGGIYGARRPDIVDAIAASALIEWLRDTCPKCRGAEAGEAKARRCACVPVTRADHEIVPGRREEAQVGQKIFTRVAASPLPGCPKCGGMGRIFSAPKESRGVRCLSCHGTGRVAFGYRERFRVVNKLLGDAARVRGKRVKALRLDAFAHWAIRYHHFLDTLRTIDRQMGAGISLTTRPSRGCAEDGLADFDGPDPEDD